MLIYEYECSYCGAVAERIEKCSNLSWEEEREITYACHECNRLTLRKAITSFKIGTKALETTGKSGYQTDDLTLGKLIDEGGIPYEEKARLRERDKMILRQKEYSKQLNARAKKHGFDPFTDE